jgi:hypothetical protein
MQILVSYKRFKFRNISFFFFGKPNLSFVVKGAGAGSEGFSVESLFGIPDPRQRPSSTTFQPIGK